MRIPTETAAKLAAEKANRARNGIPINGGIHLSAEVHCAICEQAYLGLDYPKRRAEEELRRGGWRTMMGLWVCPDHGAETKA